MKRKAKRRPAPQGREESSAALRIPAGRVRAQGLGVAARFSIAAASAIAVSLVVFGLVLYQSLGGILSDEIDAAGVQTVRAFAVVDADCWRPLHKTAYETHDPRTGPANLTPEQKAHADRRSQQNRERLRSLVDARGGKLLDAVVVDRDFKQVLSGSSAIVLDAEGSPRELDGVKIQEGVYIGNARRERARTYTADVRDETGAVAARAIVALSAAKIDESLGRVLKTLLILTVVFLGVGIVVSLLVARRITRPIEKLASDIETVARGNLEHRTHAHSNDEVGVLARTFDRMTQSVRELQVVQQQQATQEHQMGVAREVQAALVPEKLPAIPGFDAAGMSRSASRVAADFYDVSEMAGGARLLAVVSASGSGIPGAMVVTMARSILKSLAGAETSPAELLRKVNRVLAPDLRRGMYVSALLVRVEPASGRIVVANAGHAPLVVSRVGAEKAEPFHGDGIALGFDKGPIFDRTIKDRELELAPGERLTLVTRSLFAIHDAGGVELGEDAAYELIQRESEQPSSSFVARILEEIEAFRAGTEPTEDVTFLTLRRTA